MASIERRPRQNERMHLAKCAQLSGMDERTRHDYERDVRNHLLPHLGTWTSGDRGRWIVPLVRQWANQLQTGVPDPRRPRRTDNTFHLGPPKAEASRRTIVLSGDVLEVICRHLQSKMQWHFLFTIPRGAGGDTPP